MHNISPSKARPTLKQKDYNIGLVEDPTKIEQDFFKTQPTRDQMKKREDHVKTTLEWANKSSCDQDYQNACERDVSMEEVDHINDREDDND